MAQFIPVINAQWCHLFDGLQFSSNDFYSTVEANIKARKLDSVACKRINLSQGGIFSSNREYLRITRKNLAYDVCSAPYGNGFFISYWHGEMTGYIRALLSKVPVIGVYLAKIKEHKTYFQADTEAMFRISIQNSILEAVHEITTAKGLRKLSDVEMQPKASMLV